MQAAKILKILWKVIKIVILAALILPFTALILFVLFIAFLFSPLNTGFSYIENQDLIKFKSLTNANGETLLIYRKKRPSLSCSEKIQTCICYTHFIKANKPFAVTQQKMLQEGYELVSESDCIAQTKNLHEFKLSWAAPFYHYAGSREYLIYGSTKNLKLTALMNDKRQIWHKKDHIPWGQPIDYDHEVIFYPEFDLVQINTLGYYSVR